MTVSKVYTAAVEGLDGELVEVEVDILPGLPAVNVVGLPDKMVQEARERVRSAVRNSGCDFPMRRITVNLAPADIRKEGSAFDLPMALGVIIASEQLVADVSESLFLGELALDGRLRSTQGILPMVALARDRGLREVFVPESDVAEAALVDGVDVYGAETLLELVNHLSGDSPLERYVRPADAIPEAPAYEGTDFAEVRGQEHVKRALEVAAAGGHNLLMIGPAGAGKTLLARALPSILPSMTPEESLMVTRIYSVAGLLKRDTPLVRQRPRRPVSSEAAASRVPEKSASHTAVCCSWMSCRSSDSRRWRCYGSPSRTISLRSHAPTAPSRSRLTACWSAP
jgi:magnesium chelatase family protein